MSVNFLDGIVPILLEREDIAGATVSIVKDGKLLFAKGYGYADVGQKKTVVAEKTLFRVASVSKLFIWTAVMQLAEQGKLDLDRDVNEYLDFKIPEAFEKPITLKNLMTHTAGFEEQVKDYYAAEKKNPDLGQFLKTHIPKQIFPPGTTPGYSSYGATLAAYIVERVSGQPFAEYVEEHIFRPLEMTHSTFVQSLPSELAPFISSSYEFASGEPQPFYPVSRFPEGGLSTTATDLANFMLAHLQDGQFGDARILQPETVRLMHSRLFTLHPEANAMCYGFYEQSRNARRIIGHAGYIHQFHSDLYLIPDAGVGFFISYNGKGKGETPLKKVIWEAFLDRYFPYTPPDMPTLDSAKQDSDAVSGKYMISSPKLTDHFLKH